ncbi:MAG TPA: molybdate ABC transporter substrate-binding protein [Xanthobacteraceae bacterium]|jgi:molybdenum ABC transporter molybdate-binding protein|nr:molybdate ABC transporter substrate-binding protein [Xanthobacteraceae bacterium]
MLERELRTLRGSDRDKPGGVPRGCLYLCVVAALLCAIAFLAPAAAAARDLVVYGEPTLEKALKSVGSLWQARTGTRVNVLVAPTNLSYAQIDRGARCDVIFAPAGAATEEAARAKIIQGATITRALRNGLVLVGTKGAAGPIDGANVADISRLIAGERLAIANPERDPTGARALELLRKIGIAADDNRALAVAESSAGVVNLLATDKARLGIVYSTDAIAGFKLVVPLLDQPPIEYVVAQARDPQSDTQPFMAFVKSAAAQAAFKSAGLAPIDDAQAAGGGND